jgi:molybdate transport system substrate-binding protein
MRMRCVPAVLLASMLVMVSACGGGGEQASNGSHRAEDRLTVSAAASLRDAFTEYGEQFADGSPRFSFAGSDELAAQIRQGVRPDVYAAANTELPRQLHADGLVERPTVFARNRLVLAVPAGDAGIASLDDLQRDGVTLAVGSSNVPIGAYTSSVLEKLPANQEQAIRANVRSEEPNVAGIIGKLTQGAVDAGFLYVSDVRGTDGKLEAIELPDELRPSVAYGIAVVKGTGNPDGARTFVDGLLDGRGADALRDAGLEVPVPR